ncbi:Cucumisin protein [Spatholobus suberectus]|nr:Cucumisin protein [Spatholobus suberectus]
MISLGWSHLLQILTCILLLTQSISGDDRQTYIVYMGHYPKGMELPELLHTSMVQSVLDSKFAPDALLHSYKSFNGFVARLTNQESLRMRGMDGVVSVIPTANHELQTTLSWDFLGFPQNVKRTSLESDIIVGVIDTGIWRDSDSFNDDGFGPPPQKWKGSCQNFTCNKLCGENSLDEALVKGKIVLCDGYREVGFASGAAGIIFQSNGSKVVADIFALPAVHISHNDGNLIYSYIKSTRNPVATIFKSNQGKDASAPYIAPFSSRGPNAITPDILKPDIAAPGVNILAAWPPKAPISGVKGDSRMAKYNLLSGTSMACPHVTAAAVYVKSFHPNWSPAAIKSALMTTGNDPLGSNINFNHSILFFVHTLRLVHQ